MELVRIVLKRASNAKQNNKSYACHGKMFCAFPTMAIVENKIYIPGIHTQ